MYKDFNPKHLCGGSILKLLEVLTIIQKLPYINPEEYHTLSNQ
jgi:hypothetical protein